VRKSLSQPENPEKIENTRNNSLLAREMGKDNDINNSVGYLLYLSTYCRYLLYCTYIPSQRIQYMNLSTVLEPPRCVTRYCTTKDRDLYPHRLRYNGKVTKNHKFDAPTSNKCADFNMAAYAEWPCSYVDYSAAGMLQEIAFFYFINFMPLL
jgi:hypothetical protein